MKKKIKSDLFEKDKLLLAELKNFSEENSFGSLITKLNFKKLMDGYENLIYQMQCVIKISDRTGKRLFQANCELQDAEDAIRSEKNKYENLLLSIFPETIGLELLHNRAVVPHRADNVTVMFTDFVDFTQLTASIDPELLIRELNDVFCAFDLIMQRNGCERIKTIGDGYMAACGVPIPDSSHAFHIVKAALECIQYLEIRNAQLLGKSLDIRWEIRVGINSGPVVGGIVGTQRFSYDIFGDTVNTASRIEAQAGINGIAFPESTKALIEESFECLPLGMRNIKGKGDILLYTASNKTEIDEIEFL